MTITSEHILFGLMLTTIAGLSTGIGGLFVFFYRKSSAKVLSFVLGFSAGVMIYVSFVEIFPEAMHQLESVHSDFVAGLLTLVGFFAGMLVIAAIDKFVPDQHNPHEVVNIDEAIDVIAHKSKKKVNGALYKTSILTVLAIAIHNFPEGIATFIAAVQDPSLGIAIAIAIALHNIPEGIAVAIPVYEATGSRKKAFVLSLLSGLAEPIGAIVAILVLLPFLTPTLFGIVFASVAGIMVYISIDELLPAAREYGKPHTALSGLMIGMAVMGISLLFL